MSKKKVYISLPMSGVESSVWRRYQDAVDYVKHLKGYELCEIIPPLDITDYMPHKKLKINTGKFTWGYYIGKDIELLSECTDIFLSHNWEKSKGCRIEKYVAEELNLNILYHDK